MSFCQKCGASMIETEIQTGRHSIYTGNEMMYIVSVCPNKKWWNHHEKTKRLKVEMTEIKSCRTCCT